jgi:Zn-dependent peptidase ImmA (M78 family)
VRGFWELILEEQRFRARVVWLIANGQAEEALEELAEHYGVKVPKLRVGLPKRHKKKILACYGAKSNTISVLNSDVLKEPFVILHEFYHCVRTGLDVRHRGTERYANEFAMEFIRAYEAVMV